MFTFKLDELKYFFINEQLYKIIKKKKMKTKIVKILSKIIENTQISDSSGICKIYNFNINLLIEYLLHQNRITYLHR